MLVRLERRERRDDLHCGVVQPDPTNRIRRIPAVKFFIIWC